VVVLVPSFRPAPGLACMTRVIICENIDVYSAIVWSPVVVVFVVVFVLFVYENSSRM